MSMRNVLDYVELYGDILFEEIPFSDVDNLILCEIPYLDFREVISQEQKIMTLEEVGKNYFEKYPYKEKKRGILPIDRAIKLFHSLYSKKRFSKIRVSDYVYEVKKDMQFGALTYRLSDGTMYIAYMGTDDSLIGWEEDCFMMYQFPIPSQKKAIEYIDQVVRFTDRHIRLGGHSKGGNLAMTAAMFAKKSIQKRIQVIYNNDGPGFREEQVHTKEYEWMTTKLKMFVPEESVVGMLMFHHTEYQVVRSTEKKILQHDGVTWECFGTRFVPGQLTSRSQQTDHMISNWIQEYDDQQRKKLVATFFQILKKSGISTKSELDNLKITGVIKIIKELKQTNAEDKRFLIQAFRTLLSKKNLQSNLVKE